MQKLMIEKWIAKQSPGSAFSACDLPPSLSRGMRDVILSRMAASGRIIRILRGIYGLPKPCRLLSDTSVPPSVDEVARALARKFDWRIMPSDGTVANGLGISTQVPARTVYVSDGPTRHYIINGTQVEFRHCCQRETSMTDRNARQVIRGLKGLGRSYVTPEVVTQISGKFTKQEWLSICKASAKASDWISRLLWDEMRRRNEE